MRVEIFLSGQLYWYDKENRKKLLLDNPGNVALRELPDMLGVPAAEVAAFLVNGAAKPPEYCVQDGDKVELVPVIGGG